MSDDSHQTLVFVDGGEQGEYLQRLIDTFCLTRVSTRPDQPYLRWGEALSLAQPNTTISPISVDFLAGKNNHRRKYGGGAGQMLCKAVGLKPQIRPTVLDMTAGLGQDAFVLASLGCRVSMQERSPYAAALLYDGLQRLVAADPLLSEQLDLTYVDSREREPITKYEVVYLDPMYPEHKQKAAVNKSMAVFRELIGGDIDADDLLDVAFEHATHRVVVKRPKQGRFLAGKQPSHQLLGKSSRYDIYAFKTLLGR